MKKGFFGSLFDLDHDGELDCTEQFLDFMAFQEVMGFNDSDEDEETDDDYDY